MRVYGGRYHQRGSRLRTPRPRLARPLRYRALSTAVCGGFWLCNGEHRCRRLASGRTRREATTPRRPERGLTRSLPRLSTTVLGGILALGLAAGALPGCGRRPVDGVLAVPWPLPVPTSTAPRVERPGAMREIVRGRCRRRTSNSSGEASSTFWLPASHCWTAIAVDVKVLDHHSPDQSVYEGHLGYGRWLRDWDAAWDEWSLELERLVDAGDSVVAMYRMRVKGKGSGAELDVSEAQVWEIRSGTAVRLDRSTALRPKPSKPLGCRSSSLLPLHRYVSTPM